MALQIRRGTDLQRSSQIFNSGELIYTTDQKHLWIGDGSTTGGTNVHASAAGAGLTWNSGTNKLDLNPSTFNFTTNDLVEGNNKKFFTTDLAQDAAGAMIAAGVYTGITFSYNSTTNTLTGSVASASTAIINDTTPQLGGNLGLNNHNITGTGLTINGTTGNVSVNNLSVTGTLGADLNAGGFNLSNVATLSVTTGLGANLSLNTHNIIGSGDINTTGNITTTGNLTLTGNVHLTQTSPTNTLFNITGATTGVGATETLVEISRYTGVTANDIQNNDYLHQYRVTGRANGNSVTASLLQTQVKSNISNNNFLSDLNVYVNNGQGGGNSFVQYIFSGNGWFKSPSVVLAPIPTTVINTVTPQAGLMVYDSTKNSLEFYNGSNYLNTMGVGGSVPPTSTSAGTPGQVTYDSSYIYVCVAPSSWIRAARASF